MSKNAPLVSVIIPNYNHARFLPERMQSVLGQTYQNFEVIILDDCSTDNSREIIEQYRDDPHVTHIVYNDQNSGSPFKQWGKGIALAKGEYIWIAESDDSCSTAMLEKLVKAIVENDAVYAFCRSQRYQDDKLFSTYQGSLTSDYVGDGHRFIEQHMLLGNAVVNASSCIFKKDVAMSVDRQYTDYKATGDWLYWIEMAEQGKVCFLDEAMNYFRSHGDNTTAKIASEGINLVEIYKIYEYLYAKHIISKQTFWELHRMCIIGATKNDFFKQTRGEILNELGYRGLVPLRVFLYKFFSHLGNII